jgi:2-oxoglutarate dehydrogenase E2 component (dihydrolipoamide succinyltransferase)
MDPTYEPANLVVPAVAEPIAEAPGADDTLRTEVLVHTDAAEPADPDAFDEPPSALEIEPSAADTLSPAVRRLVRQYDLDVTGIHGTGPSGKLRVSDVIGLLGGRGDVAARPSDLRDPDERTGLVPAFRPATAPRTPTPAPATPSAATPATTVFECDLSRVLSHRKQQRRNNVELLLASYYVVACAEALQAVPEVAAAPTRLGVSLHSADGEPRTTLIAATDDERPAALDDRLRALDRELRTVGDADLAPASLLIHHYGLSGSLLATSTPIGAGHAASLGLGRVRREVVVKNVDGDESPRITAVCYVTLTFLPDRVALHRANRFLAQLVRVLEQWPE